jgi:hypothetical protein
MTEWRPPPGYGEHVSIYGEDDFRSDLVLADQIKNGSFS